MTIRDRHLGEAVHDYVDGLLDDPQTLQVERHLLVCGMCRTQVDQQRQLTESLRAFQPDPRRQQDLVAGLLGLAQEGPAPVVPVRRSPSLVTCDAPPQYESVRQHPMLLALVAVAGCVGVVMVAANMPGRAQAGIADDAHPETAHVRPASTAGSSAWSAASAQVIPVAMARAEQDAVQAIAVPDAQPLLVHASVRVR